MVFPDPARNTVEHGWGDHADVVFTTDDPLYPSGLDVNIHAIAVDPADTRRLVHRARRRRRPARRAASPPAARLSSAPRTAGAPGRASAELATERVFAHPRRRRARVRALARDRRLRRRAGRAGSASIRPAGRRSSPAASDATRRAAYARLRDRRTAGRRTSPRTAAAPGARATARWARCWPGTATEAWGPAARSKPSARSGRRLRRTTALTAYVGLRGLRGAGRRALQRHREDDATAAAPGRSSTRRPTGPSANLDASWIEARALEDGHSVWFDAPYDLAVAPGDPDVVLRHRPLPHLPHARRRPDLGAGELRAPRRRPVGEPRPRRHQHLRRALGPVRREARLHQLHRHRPLPQRGRRRHLDRLHDAASPRAGATRPTGSPSIPR